MKKRYIILTLFVLLIASYMIIKTFSEYIIYWDYMRLAKNVDVKSTYAYKAKHRFVELPDRQLNDSTLRGIDSDKNGFRDDIDYFIYKMARDEIERKAFYQLASAYEMMFEYKDNMYTKDGKFLSSYAYGIGDALAKSEDCFLHLKHNENYPDINDYFWDLYLNTKKRNEYVSEYIFTGGFTIGLSPNDRYKKGMELCD